MVGVLIENTGLRFALALYTPTALLRFCDMPYQY
jgi:hypothetical protein